MARVEQGVQNVAKQVRLRREEGPSYTRVVQPALSSFLCVCMSVCVFVSLSVCLRSVGVGGCHLAGGSLYAGVVMPISFTVEIHKGFVHVAI